MRRSAVQTCRARARMRVSYQCRKNSLASGKAYRRSGPKWAISFSRARRTRSSSWRSGRAAAFVQGVFSTRPAACWNAARAARAARPAMRRPLQSKQWRHVAVDVQPSLRPDLAKAQVFGGGDAGQHGGGHEINEAARGFAVGATVMRQFSEGGKQPAARNMPSPLRLVGDGLHASWRPGARSFCRP